MEREFGSGYATVLSHEGHLISAYREGDEERIVALKASDGSTAWEYVIPSKVPTSMSLDTSWGAGPAASPLIVDDRVYALSFLGQLHCIDVKSGEAIWKQDLQKSYGIKTPYFGIAASPVRVGDKIVVLVGGAFAFGLDDGKLKWRNQEVEASYASPIVVRTPDGKAQVVGGVAGEIVGLDAETGKTLWRVEHANPFRTILSSPIAGDDWIFASSYQRGSAGLAWKPSSSTYELDWEEAKPAISYTNVVRLDDTVIGMNGSILTAVDARSGKTSWRHRGLKLGNFVRSGDRLLHLGERGTLSLLRINDQGVEELGSAQVLTGRSWTAPTLIGSRVYVRNQELLRAYDLTQSGDGGSTVQIAHRTSLDAVPAQLAKEFLSAKTELSKAYYAGDVSKLDSSRARFESWREHPVLGHLAEYYRGFAYWQASLVVPRAQQLSLVDAAVAALERSVELQPSFAEAHALLGNIYPTYYRLAPRRAAVVALLGDEHLKSANELAPNHPHVQVFAALRRIYKPADHGGNRVAGLAALEKALGSYAELAPENSSLDPDWGHAVTWAWQAQALLSGDDKERATALRSAQRALELNPEFAYAKRLVEQATPKSE